MAQIYYNNQYYNYCNSYTRSREKRTKKNGFKKGDKVVCIDEMLNKNGFKVMLFEINDLASNVIAITGVKDGIGYGVHDENYFKKAENENCPNIIILE
jgi:hypothetical protein